MRSERWKRVRTAATSHAAACFVLTALNLAICWRLFKVEYSTHFSSIEGAFIGIARYISTHWGDFSWWPLWQCGMPYQDTYVPLLHLTAAVVATLGDLSAARAYHAVTGVTYALGPATVYLMAVRLGAQRGGAFLSALLYSLFSPSALLMPEVARDIGGYWYDRRLQVLTVYGEGPHISAMTVLPVAILALQTALLRRTRRTLALAALPVAAVFLTNVPGTMALGLAVFCWLCAQPPGSRLAAWRIAVAASLLAYGLACYGIPPSSLGIVGGNVGSMHAGFAASLKYGPVYLALVLAAFAAAGYLLARLRLPLAVRFPALYFGLFATLVLTSDFEKFELLPQVGRLHLEMEMAACLLIGMAAWKLYTLLPRWFVPVLVVLAVALAILQFRHYRARARSDIQYAHLPSRSEYTTARWLDANMHGRRVYITGSGSFWLNAFTGTPQMTGCCDQGRSVPVLSSTPYLVNTAAGPEYTELGIAYLRALGVEALVASGPESTDEYKDIREPGRFAAFLPVLHRENGDTIYSVTPWRDTPALAHILRPGEQPASAERPDVVRYAAAVTDRARPQPRFEWTSGTSARIRAPLRPGDTVSVQIAWFPGWKAFVNGRQVPAAADGLGLIALRPACEGDCEITLRWTGRPDQRLAAVVSLLSLLLFAACTVTGRARSGRSESGKPVTR